MGPAVKGNAIKLLSTLSQTCVLHHSINIGVVDFTCQVSFEKSGSSVPGTYTAVVKRLISKYFTVPIGRSGCLIKPCHCFAWRGFLLCVCLSVCVSVTKISKKILNRPTIFGGGLPSDPGRKPFDFEKNRPRVKGWAWGVENWP